MSFGLDSHFGDFLLASLPSVDRRWRRWRGENSSIFRWEKMSRSAWGREISSSGSSTVRHSISNVSVLSFIQRRCSRSALPSFETAENVFDRSTARRLFVFRLDHLLHRPWESKSHILFIKFSICVIIVWISIIRATISARSFELVEPQREFVSLFSLDCHRWWLLVVAETRFRRETPCSAMVQRADSAKSHRFSRRSIEPTDRLGGDETNSSSSEFDENPKRNVWPTDAE